MMRRIGIFVFFDANGIIDRYIPYMLTDLMKNLERLVIVVNGKITDEGRAVLEQFSSEFVIRENKGFDTWAYKEGMDYVGWDELSQYDEVVIFNDTVMGPVYPFAEMFDEMSKRDVDFWGITRHYKDMANPYNCVYGHIPAHIQSYFEVFRQSFVKSADFQNYWDNLFPINSYEDAVGKHEIVFTKKFEDLGYKWDTYINAPELEKRHSQPLMAYADLIIRNYRCPIFKKRLFFNEYDWTINTNIGQEPRRILGFIRDLTDYPEEYIIETLLRARNLRELYMNFHWNYILPVTGVQKRSDKRLVEFVILQEPLLLEDTMQYLRKLPEDVDLVLIIENAIAEEAKFLIERYGVKAIEVNYFQGSLFTAERVQDFYAMLPECDCVALYFDRDITSSLHKPMDEAICYKELETLVGSGDYLHHVMDVFEQKKTLGLLATPTLNHGVYKEYARFGWGETYSDVVDCLEKLDKHVRISEDVSPILVQDLSFIASHDALLDIQADVESVVAYLTEEKGYDDDKIREVLSRLLPLLMQSNGAYTGFVTNTEFAAIELDNREYQLTAMIDDRNNWCGMYNDMLHQRDDAIGERNAMRHERDVLQAKVDWMENSRSWKITKLLRKLKDIKGE